MANIYNDNITSNTLVRGTNDDDSIYNEGWGSVTIAAAAGDDTIRNVGASTIRILGEAGDDSIYGGYGCYYLTVNGGDGDDTIKNDFGSNILLVGETGNDYIYNSAGQQVTISAGDESDTFTQPAEITFQSTREQGTIQSATTVIALQSTRARAQAMILFSTARRRSQSSAERVMTISKILPSR